jgi:hypothetical protein
VVADDEGYLSLIGRTSTRIGPQRSYVGSAHILKVERTLNGLVVATPYALVFANLADSSMQPFGCELSQTGPCSIVDIAIEQRPNNEMLLFALTNCSSMAYFKAKSTAKPDQFECRLVSTVRSDSFDGKQWVTAVKGYLLV